MDQEHKADSGKPRYSLLSPEIEAWIRSIPVKAPSSPSEALPLPDGSIYLDGLWEALEARWGAPGYLEEVVRGLTFGAERYGDYNWTKVEYVRYYDAMRRHVQKGWHVGSPNPIDEESGLHHLVLAGCNVVIMKGLELLAEKEKDGAGSE